MRRGILRALIVLTAFPCIASKPKPFFREYRTIDTIYSSTRATANRELGISCLEKLAEGQLITLETGDAVKLGILPADLGSPALRSPALRAYAFEGLGKIGGPEILTYLSGKTKADLDGDSAAELWPVIQACLQAARLSVIQDPVAAEEFLDEALTKSWGAVASWAVAEVCNRGLSRSLPLVRELTKRMYDSSSSDAQIRFCEDRIRILSRDSDRLRALELSLDIDNPESSPELIRWIIKQLGDDGSIGAEQAIDKFVASLQSVQRGSPQWQKYWGILLEIPELRRVHVR